ncbi:hypothetical protein CIPAW_05G225700 [Carya illinoinensis]|nr:hypothetical protein CIPAW_05G225700 [Carya illinoinensis]
MILTRSTHLSQSISPPLPLAVLISPRPPSRAVLSLSCAVEVMGQKLH